MVRLNALAILSIAAFVFAFGGVWMTNTGTVKQVYLPPYHYIPGDYWSYLNAFFFSTVFSFLMFGASAPLAMAMEGAKYASLFSTGAMAPFDLLFILPSLLGAIAAATLGQGVVADYRNEGSLFDYWAAALLYFNIALILLFIALATRTTAMVLGLGF